MDSRRNSSEGTADQDHPPSSPAPASSGPDVQSSARSPLSGLRLLSAAASSSGSGTQDHGPASTALHSCFCQDRHDRLQHRLERANELLALRDADVTNLEEKLAHTEDRLEEQKRQRVETEDLIEQLRHQGHNLESQIAALSSHPDLGSAPPPALSRRLVARDRELHELNVAHSALQQRCLGLEQSEEALSEAASQLRRQTDALNRRVSRLREERDSLQENLRDAQLRRQRAEEMRQMDFFDLNMLASDDLLLAAHVVSMRASIARLEEQTSRSRATSLENERLLQAAQRAIAGHNQDRDALKQDRDSIARDRDSIARDRDSIARNRDSLMQDRDALAQGREVIVSD
ncbi:unnamed protein product [Phytophthora fragariaefolia]|uniref:Unnamed protein product n=1 Tax=Phytophthora fragariaefolia TaxID=1490495 RepID=A0A9W6Y2T7_9STRA|nr:unnamed protein product [Phytophthora fragariaefolia]